MKKNTVVIILLFIALNTNAFGQSLENRIETLEMKVLGLERRIMELENTVNLATSSPEKKPIKMGTWQNVDNWRILKKNMQLEKVKSILGEPLRVSQGEDSTTWWYGGAGTVTFDKGGAVVRWEEPWIFE